VTARSVTARSVTARSVTARSATARSATARPALAVLVASGRRGRGDAPATHSGRRRPRGGASPRPRGPFCPTTARGDSPPLAGTAPGPGLGGRPSAEPEWPYLALLVVPWLFLGAAPLLVSLHVCLLCMPSVR